jgi:hypothetical protein
MQTVEVGGPESHLLCSAASDRKNTRRSGMVVGVSLTQHAINSVGCFVILTLIDVVVVRALTNSIASRWFALHSVANGIISAMCFVDVGTILADPVMSFDLNKQESAWPTYFVMGLHLVHCLLPWYSATLNTQDFIHHFVFAFSLGALCLYFHWGPVSNLLNIFVCGLPGMIDYGLLALVKEGKIGRLAEKRVNAWINNWLRGPGCVIASGFIYAGWAHGNLEHIPTPGKWRRHASLAGVVLLFFR